MKTTIEVNAMDELVKATVEVALAEALTKNSNKVIEELVKTALGSSGDKYDRESYLSKALKETIREEAQKQVALYIEGHKQEISAAVASAIDSSGYLKPELIAENFMEAVKGVEVSFRMFQKSAKKKFPVDEDDDDS